MMKTMQKGRHATSLFLILLISTLLCCTGVTPRKKFDLLDKDHNGYLSLSEYMADQVLEKPIVVDTESDIPIGSNKKEKLRFSTAFTSSTAMIIATEIGDKTFFIAAVMSMTKDRVAVFLGAILALFCMTVLSTLIGLILPNLIPRSYTHIIGGILFLYFGVKLIADSTKMQADKVSDELGEVEEELLGGGKKNESESKPDEEDPESNPNNNGSSSSSDWDFNTMSDVFIQALTLTFFAEWGDRSQIATIALAAAKDPTGVTVGACFGHFLCTGMAVLGGRILASRISEKTVHLGGGTIFLLFGIHSMFFEV